MTQESFGGLVGISQQAVSDLVARGILSSGASGEIWLREYCGHLREMAAGRLAAGDLDLAAERARLAKEQADRIALQNAITREELAPAYLIEEVLAKAGSRIASILEAIPSQVRRRNDALTAEEIRAIEQEIAKARNVASAISLHDLEVDEPGAAERDQDLQAVPS